MPDDLRAGIEALANEWGRKSDSLGPDDNGMWPIQIRLDYGDACDALRTLLAAADTLLAAHPVQDECLDCGRTDGGCDRVVVPANSKVAPSYAKTGSSEPLCERPPKGWVCTRLRGHRGPCISLLETI